jgi:addiction module HigA family antidote
VPPNRLDQLLAGKRNITADTALRLSQYFGMSADLWMNLQSVYELSVRLQVVAYGRTSLALAKIIVMLV